MIDLEARKQSVVLLEQHIAEREERLSELGQDIVKLDSRVEKRIDSLIRTLEGVKDSKESKVSVVRTKEKAIEGLKKTIREYDIKRRTINEELRKETAIPREALASDARKFDARIERRVDQIIGLTKSFTESEDLKKYDEYTRSRWGWGWNERRISEDWRQNRRDSRHRNLELERQLEALDKDIASLKSRKAWLESQLESGDASAAERKTFSEELNTIKEKIPRREDQINELLSSSKAPKTKAVGRDTAHDLSKLLDDTAGDVRDDFFEIFAKYAELNKDRQKIAELKANLEARKKWLADYEAKGE